MYLSSEVALSLFPSPLDRSSPSTIFIIMSSKHFDNSVCATRGYILANVKYWKGSPYITPPATVPRILGSHRPFTIASPVIN